MKLKTIARTNCVAGLVVLLIRQAMNQLFSSPAMTLACCMKQWKHCKKYQKLVKIAFLTFSVHNISEKVKNMRNAKPLKQGDILWNGAIVSEQFAESYNRLQERIASFEQAGRPVPEYLTFGSHNLIAGLVNGN